MATRLVQGLHIDFVLRVARELRVVLHGAHLARLGCALIVNSRLCEREQMKQSRTKKF